jgi:hypothetical protein
MTGRTSPDVGRAGRGGRAGPIGPRIGRWLVAAGVSAVGAAAAACADFAAVDDPAGGLPDVAVATPSFERDVRPIFVKRCATGGCHSLGMQQAGLVLTADSAYAALVDRPSTLRSGLVRVRPFHADSSWLIDMVGPDAERRGGRPRMPLASTPLTPNQIATLVNWIDQGARPE